LGLDLHDPSHRINVYVGLLPQLIDFLIMQGKINRSCPKQFFAGTVNLSAIQLKIICSALGMQYSGRDPKGEGSVGYCRSCSRGIKKLN
jgi:hypothetical protein